MGTENQHLKTGDVIIASAFGSGIHTSDASSGVFSSYFGSPKVLNSKGFKLIRRVASVKASENDAVSGNCRVYETEDMMPLDLF